MKNIIFDLGGVVVDWDPRRIMEEYQGDPELPVSLFKKGFFQSFWQEFDRGTVTQEELVKEMSLFSEHRYAECWDLVEYVKHSLRNIPETEALIRNLHEEGYKLFCLSNMSLEFYNDLKTRPVFTYFDGQIISALEKLIKPEKEIFLLLLERFNLQAEECLFIDDLQKNIDAARKLGFHTVHFTDKEKGYREINRLLQRKQ